MEGSKPPEGEGRVYAAAGNRPLIHLLSARTHRVLDIGCGTGGNAALTKSRFPHSEVYGVTHSVAEAEAAGQYMRHCWIADIEGQHPSDLADERFDTQIFSHVLEHLRDPADVLARFGKLLAAGGQILIAVPNVLSWRMRIRFLLGDFEYEAGGVLDDTHLRFFTYFTADRMLLSKAPELELASKTASGNVPLWLWRRHILPIGWSHKIDEWGCQRWPNLFGDQILIRAIKR
jgi:SAM-dependent methyltransferase